MEKSAEPVVHTSAIDKESMGPVVHSGDVKKSMEPVAHVVEQQSCLHWILIQGGFILTFICKHLYFLKTYKCKLEPGNCCSGHRKYPTGENCNLKVIKFRP